MGMYTHATTVITVGGKSTKQIKINAGVKQGCPLSPLLFNLIIDELLEKLRRLNIGIKVGDDLLYCMAFADDLVLLTEERIHMQILIEETKQFFDDKGLTANAGKCASLRVVPVAKKQSMKVITAKHRKWGDEMIPSITFKDLVKYLGVEIGPDGRVRLPRKTWQTYLQNLEKSHLNPIQKVEAIRQVIVARIQYQIRLSEHGLEEARKLNRMIRKSVKRVLHLPVWTNTSWIHHRNGMNIPDLVATTMLTRTKATTKMKTSKDSISQHIGDQLNPDNERQLERINLLNTTNPKEAIQQRLEEELSTKNNGRSLTTALRTRHKRSWLWTQRGLTPGNKL